MRYAAQIFDLMQLLYEEGGFNDHTVRCEIRLDSRLDEAVLRGATAAVLRSVPILATAFRRGSRGFFWESIPASDLDRSFVAAEDEGEFEAAATRRIAEGEGPQLKVVYLHGERGAVAVTANHMLADGAALKGLVYYLCETYSRLREDPNYVPPTVDGDRGLGAVLRAVGPLALARALLGRGEKTNRPGEATFPFEDEDEARPFVATRLLGGREVAGLRERCRSLGATVNDAFVAAFYRVLGRKLGAEAAGKLEIPISVDMRRYLPDRGFGGLSNLSSSVIPELGFREGEGFDATVARAKAAMDALKGRNIGLGGFARMGLLDALPRRMALAIMRRSLELPLIGTTNLGALVPARLRFAGTQVTSAYACGSIKYKPHFQVALSGYDGTLTLSSNLYGGPKARAAVEAFLDGMAGELASGD